MLPATLSLEGVYLLRCPPQFATWRAPHGQEDLYSMNAFTVGAGGRKFWLQEGPRYRTEGPCGCAGSTSSMGAADTGGGPWEEAAGGLGRMGGEGSRLRPGGGG